MRSYRIFLSLLIASLSAGCAALGGVQESYVVCPYDKVWDASLEAMKAGLITVQDKHKGVIETAWVENPAIGRPYGAFGRNLEVDKDRARLVVTLKQMNDVTSVGVNEVREHWGFRGGGRLFQWIPVEPSEDAMADTLKRINTKLKERGCLPA